MSLIEQVRRNSAIWRQNGWNKEADVMDTAGDRLEAMQAEIESKDKRLQAVRRIIEFGYPVASDPTVKCPHDRLGSDDCVACYDEALLAALDGLHSQEKQHG